MPVPDAVEPMPAPGHPERLHHERLSVPLRWWVQGTIMVLHFWGYGSPRIEVEDGWLRAGRARIPGEYLGGADPLDPDATRRVAGRDADARAYLLLRPYLKRAVRISIRDPRDPAPYWLVSTRDPEHLAAAIRVISTGPTPG